MIWKHLPISRDGARIVVIAATLLDFSQDGSVPCLLAGKLLRFG